MRITTLFPHPALRPHIVRYLSAVADFPSPVEQFTGPAGGPAIIVLMGGTQTAAVPGGVLEPTPPAYFCGHLDRALSTVLSGSGFRFFAVHFTATGAYTLLRRSVRELTNQGVDIGAVAGPDLRAWAASLAEAPDDTARAASTDRVLLARLFAWSLRPHASRVLETATAACGQITHADGRIGVEALAKQLYTTPRTLLRHFEEAVGLSVRSHARITRFLAVRAYLDHHPNVSWSEIAFRFGYADQSHLVRDFRRYYGEPPSVFRARQHEARLITLVNRGPDEVLSGTAEPIDA